MKIVKHKHTKNIFENISAYHCRQFKISQWQCSW